MSSSLLEKKLFAFFEDRSLKHFAEFFSTKTPKFKLLSEPFYELDGFQEYFSDGEKLGEIFYEDEGKRLLIAGFKSTRELSERSSKKRQFELAKKTLKNESYDAGIFIFYDSSGNFRMSLVYQIPAGRKSLLSDYKRYTYFVEQNEPYHTFLKQIGDCDFSSFEKIIEAFSVEPLTKQFYQEIANWYFWALKNVKFPPSAEAQPNGRNIALIRLITRLMFIWFLKKRDLIPDALFDEKELSRILKNFNPLGEDSTYYKAILQNLFFATLSCKQEERRFAEEGKFFGKGIGGSKDFGNQYAYRFKELFAISEEEILNLFKDIPFLNGGLFESLDNKDEEFYIDGFTRRKNFQPYIPNFLFFAQKEQVDLSKDYGEVKYKKAEVRGIINIFKSYNFTIDESSPIDVEVALDPEMLGRVFENLLASYNPETATTARKATGSYYTPREIVDYMVEESLKEYFKTQIPGIDEEKLDQLFSFSDEHKSNPFDEETTDKLISAIDNLKVIDPAVGSGAFPMGVLHKLVFVLQKLDPQNVKWFQKQVEKANEIPDPTAREEALRAIEEKFKEKELDYGRKLYIIQNCLYGVDIQPIAIQICKLRFFISLLVDEKIDKRKPNHGIEPLPNLETNFVCANTLIGLDYGKNPIFKTAPEVRKLEEKIRELRKKFFTAYTPEEKEKIRKEDEKLRSELAEVLKEKSFPENSAEKIANWDPYDSNRCADWFDPEWMFGVEEGFDIVIGNPPYVRQERIKELKPILKEQGYKTFVSTADIYVYFYEKGYNLLKTDGILCFISSNKWMRAKYGEPLRKFLKENTQVLKLIDFSGYRVFAQTVDTCIVLFKKKPEEENTITFAVINSDVKNPITYAQENWKTLSQSSLSDSVWTLADEKILKLKEKIEKIGKPLKEWNVRINRGVLTGYNKAFIIDNETKERLCREDPKSIEILKPILRGRDIGRYYYRWAGLWLIYIPWHFPLHNRKVKGASKEAEQMFKKQYPAIYNHLFQYKKQLENRNKAETGIRYEWYALQRFASDYYEDFEKEKIVWQRVTRQFSFVIVPKGWYILDSMAFLVGDSLKYILGLLNSTLIDYYIKTYVHLYSDKGFLLSNQYVEKIPLPPITSQNQSIAQKIEMLVDKILSLTQSEDYPENKEKQLQVKEYEKEIDHLVYKLYNLTPEEIELIEKNVS